MSEFGNRGFTPETEIKPEGKENIEDRSQWRKIEDLDAVPNLQDLTEDLEVLSILTKDPAIDESTIQTIISNWEAVKAVRMGWLKVIKDGVDKDGKAHYTAFTTPAWEEERKRQNAPVPKKSPKSNPEKITGQERGAIRFDQGEKHEKRNGNGNGKKERSLVNFLSQFDELKGRYLVDAKKHEVTIFTPSRAGIEKKFEGEDKDVMVEVVKYVYSTYKKPK